MTISPTLRRQLVESNQEGFLEVLDSLDAERQKTLASQLEKIDLRQLAGLVASVTTLEHGSESGEQRAQRAKPPHDLVRQPETAEEHEQWATAREIGLRKLAEGKVGAILVAGGQGTRLGFDQPKGMFPIGPVSGATLFQILAGQVKARGDRAGKPIPYFIMTSDATDEPTREFFARHENFGLDPADVFFFRQGNLPAVDAETGQILLAEPGQLALSPDGHGGILGALQSSGMLDEMARRGIEVLYYHQVDNPTAIVCDPAFLGWHVLQESEMSTKVVAKKTPQERMGVLCDVDGMTEIIEYSDLPAELADKRDEAGEPIFWAGNTAIHALSLSFLQRLCDGAHDLPFHVAHKVVSHWDATSGQQVTPSEPNALKFERFIFDALPQATRALVVEADREREFNPVKNAEGNDSPETAQAAIDRIGKRWLAQAGYAVDEEKRVEISPRFAVEPEEVRGRIAEADLKSGTIYIDA